MRAIVWLGGDAVIPVFVIARDRPSYLRRTIASLSRLKDAEIHIIDHGTTQPEALNWMALRCPFIVWHCGDKRPHDLWEWDNFRELVDGRPYAVTDPDIRFNCKTDLIQRCLDALEEFPHLTKAGPALRLDDLPATDLADRVCAWEGQFWARELRPGLIEAPIDTTFAVYRPLGQQPTFSLGPGGRLTSHPVMHLPWYEPSDPDITDELRYYREHARPGASHWLPEV